MSSNSSPVSFEVDLDGLLQLVTHLKSIRKDIFELGLGGPPQIRGGMGQPIVEQALEDFGNAWAYGIQVIGDDMDEASTLATGAHDAYRQAESTIADAAGSTSSPSGDGGGGW